MLAIGCTYYGAVKSLGTAASVKSKTQKKAPSGVTYRLLAKAKLFISKVLYLRCHTDLKVEALQAFGIRKRIYIKLT